MKPVKPSALRTIKEISLVPQLPTANKVLASSAGRFLIIVVSSAIQNLVLSNMSQNLILLDLGAVAEGANVKGQYPARSLFESALLAVSIGRRLIAYTGALAIIVRIARLVKQPFLSSLRSIGPRNSSQSVVLPR